MSHIKALIGLPAYNEEAGIASVLMKVARLKKISKYNIQVIVVNDGSIDNTADIVLNISNQHNFIKLLNHETNKGLGDAIKTILDYAIDNLDKDDVLITLDADNTHDPLLIEEMIDKLINQNLDLVVASRFTKGGREIGLSNIRKMYSRGAKYYFKLFFPIHNLNDYSSGFRAYRVSTLKKAQVKWNDLVTTDGFDCMAEIAAKFSKMQIRAGEVPLVLHYDYKEGKSKMRVVKTVKGYFSLLSKVNRI